MSRGGYRGGSTLIGPASGWFGGDRKTKTKDLGKGRIEPRTGPRSELEERIARNLKRVRKNARPKAHKPRKAPPAAGLDDIPAVAPEPQAIAPPKSLTVLRREAKRARRKAEVAAQVAARPWAPDEAGQARAEAAQRTLRDLQAEALRLEALVTEAERGGARTPIKSKAPAAGGVDLTSAEVSNERDLKTAGGKKKTEKRKKARQAPPPSAGKRHWAGRACFTNPAYALQQALQEEGKGAGGRGGGARASRRRRTGGKAQRN